MVIGGVKLVLKNELDLSYIDAKDLLISTGIRNVSVSGSEITFSCFSDNHLHGDNNPSARMNVNTTLWYCAGCKICGNAITFLSQYKQISQSTARRLLEERYGGELTSPIEDLSKEVERIMSDDKKIIDDRRAPSEEWIEKFELDEAPSLAVDYMIDRGFESKTLIDWEVGYDHYSNRITIPIRDHKGKLVGFKGRQANDDKYSSYPRYMNLGDKPGFNRYGFDPYCKSEYVFGLDRIYNNNINNSYQTILCEGELNVLALYQHGFTGLSVAGSEFSHRQAELIITYLNSVTVYFDNDESGRKGTKKVIEMLSPYIDVRVIQNAPGDASDIIYEHDELKRLILGADPALLLTARGEL
jgi:DNA primase